MRSSTYDHKPNNTIFGSCPNSYFKCLMFVLLATTLSLSGLLIFNKFEELGLWSLTPLSTLFQFNSWQLVVLVEECGEIHQPAENL